MYFDITYIRKFLSIAINVLLICGSIIMGLGIILTFLIHVEDDSKYTAVRIVNGLKYINQSIFVVGLILIICGLIGYLTTKLNNDITVGLFATISFIIFTSVLLFTLGFVAIVIVHSSAKVDRHACIKSEFFQTAQRLFLESSRYYGSSKCKTNIQDPSQFKSNPKFIEEDIQIDSQNGYSSVLSCPHYQDLLQNLRLDKYSEEPQYIGSLEITFQCSGICSGYPIYVFSDVNRGVPLKTEGCFDAVLQFIDEIGYPLLGILWLITCLMLMVVINSTCLFFHPKRYDDIYIYKPLNTNENNQTNQYNSYNENEQNSNLLPSPLPYKNQKNHHSLQTQHTNEQDSQNNHHLFHYSEQLEIKNQSDILQEQQKEQQEQEIKKQK